jgi:hypothetical protein
MNILNAVEREAFDSPPVFNSFQRKQYFDFPSTPIRRWTPQSGLAEACKLLIKNCIICWNYLYLSQKLEEIKDTASREAFLDAGGHGSAVAWQHLNLLGEYDFSDEKLRDSIGIRPPKLVDQMGRHFGGSPKSENPIYQRG